ncbi:hypothetical protein [Streptomyces niger]|uniref:hypothetical protein n=1 Tax=Streptomyces niger TaxID=66373 RepID=UPI0018FE2522|nr:hypothetical protein [Streptomyces niger]
MRASSPDGVSLGGSAYGYALFNPAVGDTVSPFDRVLELLRTETDSKRGYLPIFSAGKLALDDSWRAADKRQDKPVARRPAGCAAPSDRAVGSPAGHPTGPTTQGRETLLSELRESRGKSLLQSRALSERVLDQATRTAVSSLQSRNGDARLAKSEPKRVSKEETITYRVSLPLVSPLVPTDEGPNEQEPNRNLLSAALDYPMIISEPPSEVVRGRSCVRFRPRGYSQAQTHSS